MVARFKPESPLVSADWLINHLNAPDVRVLDATWFMPDAGKTGKKAYQAQHIPGARFFDIDDVADTDSTLPHMLPPPEKFASRARKMGLGDGHRIVCYDQNGFCASARAWWMFRVMGHDDVTVLDGGFDAWRAAGGPLEDLPPVVTADRHFTVHMRSDLVRSLDQMKAVSQDGAMQILDSRSAERFAGAAEEPRPNTRRGHIPGSHNLHYRDLIADDGRMKSVDELKALFEKAGIDLARPIVNTCGSGVSASIEALAQAVVGVDDAAVYDGSWAEWGAESAGTPIEAG